MKPNHIFSFFLHRIDVYRRELTRHLPDLGEHRKTLARVVGSVVDRPLLTGTGSIRWSRRNKMAPISSRWLSSLAVPCRAACVTALRDY